MQTSDNDHVIRCPNCGARDVRPSQAQGLWDAIVTALKRSPMRCRQCHRRFYPRIRPKEEDTEDHSADVKGTDVE